MLLVILGICILLVILGIILMCKSYSDTLWGIGLVLVIIFSIGTLVSIGCGGEYVYNIAQSRIIDEKIAMHETENKSIESAISTIVENYQDYEKDVFANAKNESIVVIATQIYPELKSNELVKKQLDIYVENNKKIKQLKNKKLDYKVSKWLLYFGG